MVKQRSARDQPMMTMTTSLDNSIQAVAGGVACQKQSPVCESCLIRSHPLTVKDAPLKASRRFLYLVLGLALRGSYFVQSSVGHANGC